MKKYKICLWIIVSLCVFFSTIRGVSADETALTQKEVADLAKPSVVKIIQKVKGDATIPLIEVNFTDLSVKTKPDVPPEKIQIDEYLTGTGVIVSPDGYIMTNSHVISYQTIKNLIASDYIYQAIDDGYARLSEAEIKKINENGSREEMGNFAEKIADYILSQSNFNLEKTITVLNPSSRKETLEELANEGFTASVVSVNDNFFKDSRDAALIKIDQKNLPAIKLGTSTDVSTGKKVYIFGYPSTAEIDEKDLLEPTFTQGAISATKESINKDFKIFQTDAKISKGSSGGPLLDDQGRVIGLVTFITSDLTKQDGDSFAFAIPIDTAKDIIASGKISGELPTYQEGDYSSYFKTGLEFLKGNQCKKALTEFDAAKQNNPDYNLSGYLNPYVQQCGGIISSGKSIDTGWDSLKAKFGDTKYLILIVSGSGIILIAILVTAWYWLFRRMRKDEKELDNVEEFLDLNLEDGRPYPKEPSEKEEKDKLFFDRLKPK